MKVPFTQQHNVFNELDVPKFKYCQDNFNSLICFPTNLEFNRTYYIYDNGKLKAFRILAYTINDEKDNRTNLNFLVQMPNQEIQWLYNFLNQNTKVYDSVEEYVLSGGSNSINLNWKPLNEIFNMHKVGLTSSGAFHGYFFNETFYTIKDGAVCESKGHYCNGLIVTQSGCIVRISQRNLNAYKGEKGVYQYKSDAMKVLLDDMEIVDFETEPIVVNVNILPNTPKYVKLQFVE